MKNALLAFLLVATTPVGAASLDTSGLWCAPEEPEIAVNVDGVSFVDHDCEAVGTVFELGNVVPMHCSGDSGGYDTKLRVTISGDTLTLTADGKTTTYTRCPAQ